MPMFGALLGRGVPAWQAGLVSPWSVIVVAGGLGRRLGGADKAALPLGGKSTLAWILDVVPADTAVVVAGPERPTPRTVVFRQESPPGGGPVAGVAAALSAVTSPRVIIVAADMPWAGRLMSALAERFDSTQAEAVMPVDASGRAQPLFSAWDAAYLRSVLATLGDPRDRSLRDLIDLAEPARWQLDAQQTRQIADIDTPDDLRAAHEWATDPRLGPSQSQNRRKGDRTMDEWIEAVRQELGLDASVDVDGILDVARVAAHNVARPAAPVTTYLLGIAVAQGADPDQARARISALADGWPSSS